MMSLEDIERAADPADLPAPLLQAAAELAEYVRLKSQCEQYLEDHVVLKQFLELANRGEWAEMRQAFRIR